MSVALGIQDRSFEDAKGEQHTWTVSPFLAREALGILSQIVGLAGPALAQAATAIKGGETVLSGEIDTDQLSSAIRMLATSLDENTFDKLVTRLLKDTKKGAAPANDIFDLEFSQDLTRLFKILAFVIEVNYSDFWSAVAGSQNAQAFLAAAG